MMKLFHARTHSKIRPPSSIGHHATYGRLWLIAVTPKIAFNGFEGSDYWNRSEFYETLFGGVKKLAPRASAIRIVCMSLVWFILSAFFANVFHGLILSQGVK